MPVLKSQDGTSIAFDRTGNGPPLILIDGALCSRAMGPMKTLVPLLARKFTVFTYDRRGRNESGDAPTYSVKREIEDIDALVKEAGGSAILFGVSSGAALAVHAIEHGVSVSKLALYEPPFYTDSAGRETHQRHKATLQQLIGQNRRSKALTYFQRRIIGLPAFLCFVCRLMPMWSKLKTVAPTLVYDMEILGDGLVPSDKLSKIRVPTLVVAGEKTAKFLSDSSEAVAKAIPGSALARLPGQTHNVSAEALVPVLEQFLET